MNEKRKSYGAAARRTRRNGKTVVIKPLIWVAAVCMIVYSVVVIISQQVQIAELRQEKEEISVQMTEARRQNDEYRRLISSDEAEYMEKVAIDKLGYAYPNERRFYVVETH